MDTPIPALDKVRTEVATGINGLRLWIKGKSVELFAHEMRQLARHLDAEADKLDSPAAPTAAPPKETATQTLDALDKVLDETNK